MGEYSSPSYSSQDLAVIEQVLGQICRSHGWPPTSEHAMEVGRFLLARFEDGVTDPADLLQAFEQAKPTRMGRVQQV